jgi:glycosyltransferase involved in cell wall biosynthesis
VLAVNAQDVPTIFVKDRSGILRDVYVVGFLLWETSDVPRVQRLGLGLIDEAWTPTQYVADIYAPFVPTHLVGKALWDDARSPMPGTRTGARSPFTFLTVFDFHSSIERKNPLAVALAFQRAFRPDENVRLIIKTSNVNPAHWSNALGHWEKLSRVWIADNRINVVNARYSDAQMLALMEETSCFVSLHRSEGFGYVIADAMLQEIPVVATNYSGNVDFCTNETYFPVSYTLQPVDERVMHWKAEKAEWADPDIDSAAVQMRHVFDHYDEALAVARRAREHILARYNMPSFRAALRRRIEEIANRHAHREEISADLEKVAAPALPVREI